MDPVALHTYRRVGAAALSAPQGPNRVVLMSGPGVRVQCNGRVGADDRALARGRLANSAVEQTAGGSPSLAAAAHRER